MPIYTQGSEREDQLRMERRSALNAKWGPGERTRAMGGYTDPQGVEHYPVKPEEMIGRAMQNVIQGKEKALRDKIAQEGQPTAVPQEQDVFSNITSILNKEKAYKLPEGAKNIPGLPGHIYAIPDPNDPSKVIIRNQGAAQVPSEAQGIWLNIFTKLQKAATSGKADKDTVELIHLKDLASKSYDSLYKDPESPNGIRPDAPDRDTYVANFIMSHGRHLFGKGKEGIAIPTPPVRQDINLRDYYPLQGQGKAPGGVYTGPGQQGQTALPATPPAGPVVQPPVTGGTPSIPQTTPMAGGGVRGVIPGKQAKLNKEMAAAILTEAGGDKNRARQIATQRGYIF